MIPSAAPSSTSIAPNARAPIVLGCTLAPPLDGRDSAGRGLRPLRLARENVADGHGPRFVAYDLSGARLAPLPDAVAARLARWLDLGHAVEARVSGFAEDGGVEIEVRLAAR